MKEILVTMEAVSQGIAAGVLPHNIGKAKKRLAEMVLNSAPVTHELGNRRFGDAILRVEAGAVLSVVTLNQSPEKPVKPLRGRVCPACGGSGKVLVFEPCEFCDGVRCEYCEDAGQAEIPCQDCS